MVKLNKYQKKYLENVTLCLAEKVGLIKASQFIKESIFIEGLIEDPAYVMYYDPDYWVQRMIKEIKVAD